MSFLVVRSLRKTYGPAVALDTVDLSIEEGEFVTLLGPSGSGKTTLLMSIAGFTKPDSGAILLDGADITAVEPEDRNFGLVFQGYALFPHLTVAENIAFPLKVRKWSKEQISAKVEEMLRLVGLEALSARKPRELSGGQQQRVALARALSYGPRILLLDEPLSALDKTLRDTMQRELKRLHKETGVTFVYVTHDQEEAYAMSNRIAVFHDGRIVQIGTPREIYRKPASFFVAGFLGGNNMLKALRLPDVNGERFMEVCHQAVPAPDHISAKLYGHIGALTIWIRPEDIRLTPPEPEDIRITAMVVDISFIGFSDRVVVRTNDGQELSVLTPTHVAQQLAIGDAVTCAIAPSVIGFLAEGELAER